MRLICPNCSAQYEVDDSVIPDNGRDVQCSNCGHTWYQRSAAYLANRPRTGELDKKEAEEVAENAKVAEAKQAEADLTDEEIAEEEALEAAIEARGKKPLDSDVTDILREEAAHEAAERAAEATPKPDPIDDAEETPPHIQERMARLREMDDELGATAVAAGQSAGSRSELLPDIEELNSTLSPEEAELGEDADDDTQVAARRGGFRRGFALVIFLFAILALVYIYAPQIVAWNPATEPYLASYVDWVNNLRIAVDGFMKNAADRISGLLGSMGSEG